MAIANGTYVSFCNQPKTHYLATSRESRRYIVASIRLQVQALATSRESKAHFGFPWVRPWDNRSKFLHGSKENSMLVKRLAAYTHLSSTISEI